MAKIIRKTAKIFGGALSAGSQQVEQFGSQVQLGTPFYTVDPDEIQALAAWVNGFVAAIDSGTKAPYVQDMNSVLLVLAYQTAYLLQEGLAEWDVATTYFEGSTVQANSGQWYTSLVDNNVGNAPPASSSNANWLWVNPPALVPSGALPANTIPRVTGAATDGPAGSLAVAAGLLSDDGTYVIIGGTPSVSGLKYPDATVQTTAAQPVQAQNVRTGTRVAGVTYQNTTNKPIFLFISVGDNASQGSQIYCDTNLNPVTLVAQCGAPGSSNDYSQLSCIVLPGYYFKLIGATTIINAWIEYT